MFMPKDSNNSTTYLWHCHVSHIGIKRMKKLHVDGSLGSLVFWKVWDMRTMSIGVYAWRNSMQMDRLDSLDFESLETCKSYHMGKMTERPRFQYDGTRKQLFGSNTFWCMQSNECWSMQWISLCSYFTDDLSRCWVYLLDETQVWIIERFK